MVRAGEHHLKFQYLVQRLARDNKLPVTVLRDGKELPLDVPVSPSENRWLFPYLVGNSPSYFIFGPLVFTEATDNYVRNFTYGDGADTLMGYANQGNPMMTRYGERPAFPGERIVLLAHPMFVHKIGTGFRGPYADAVSELNGVKIRNLKHLVETLRNLKDDYVEFKFSSKYSDVIVFCAGIAGRHRRGLERKRHSRAMLSRSCADLERGQAPEPSPVNRLGSQAPTS